MSILRLIPKLLLNHKRHLHDSSKWIQPDGYNTGIDIYNCITKSKVPLIVLNKAFVTLYTCGPTVYDSSHIGHASCYVKLDIIQKILKNFFNLNILSVMNITDIDDKIIKKSNELSIPHYEVAKRYETEFWKDMEMLEVSRPDVVVRVTEFMPEIIDYIKTLLHKGYAYSTPDSSVNFDTEKFNAYGKLSAVSDEPKAQSSEEKKSLRDFALWKGAKAKEPSWDTEWGKGRPGWHIECSAMASAVFGSKLDIHAGGIDLKFPHHENEEAQSCAYHSVDQWVNYWMHTGHLSLQSDVKMSKSLGNTISIAQLMEEYTSQEFRMACLLSHYRSHMIFSPDAMKNAKSALTTLKSFIETVKLYLNGDLHSEVDEAVLLAELCKSEASVLLSLKDDFNTHAALMAVFKMIHICNKMLVPKQGGKCTMKRSFSIAACLNFTCSTLQKFGVNFGEKDVQSSDISTIMQIITDHRQELRHFALQTKNKELLSYCDSLREALNNCGIVVRDHGKISSWRK